MLTQAKVQTIVFVTMATMKLYRQEYVKFAIIHAKDAPVLQLAVQFVILLLIEPFHQVHVHAILLTLMMAEINYV